MILDAPKVGHVQGQLVRRRLEAGQLVRRRPPAALMALTLLRHTVICLRSLTKNVRVYLWLLTLAIFVDRLFSVFTRFARGLELASILA